MHEIIEVPVVLVSTATAEIVSVACHEYCVLLVFVNCLLINVARRADYSKIV